MQKASDIALPAYISSATASRDLVAVIVPTNRLAEKNAELFVQWQVQTETGTQPLDNDPKKQAAWTKIQAAQKAGSILENADVISQARLLAASSMESAAWLSALPVATLGNLLDDASLRIAVALRLGAVVCTEHVCVCGQRVDKFGHHGLSCKKFLLS